MAGNDLEALCANVVKNVTGALACAVVDLNNGLLIAAHHNVQYFTQTYVEALGAAAVDMVRGRGITNVEELLSSTRGEEVRHTLQEVQMTSKMTHHFMSIIPGKPDCMAVLVTDKKANIGQGWSALRVNMEKMAPLCP